MIPTYILGLLQRFGPQHGYQIKKTISEQLSGFAQVKLPTIYYHLEKMEANGLLSASSEKNSSRPEKTVYTITEKGSGVFQHKLDELLKLDYRPVFPADGIFYFSDSLDKEEITKQLREYVAKLQAQLVEIKKHGNEALVHVPNDNKSMISAIFRHHEYHYKAELDWAVSTLRSLS